MILARPRADAPFVGSANVTQRVTTWWPVLLLFGLLSALFAAFAAGLVGRSAYLEIQLWLSVSMALVWFCCAKAHHGINWTDKGINSAHLLFWSALAGPFGTAIAAALLVPSRAVTTAAGDPKPGTWPGATLSRVERLHHALLDKRLRLGRAHAVNPMLDVIIDGTQREKFDALRLIGKRYAPSAAFALKRAIEDKDASVRVLAATILAQQHNACTKRIGVLQAATRATPGEAGDWTRLGQAHLDYAESGLLEVSRADAEHDRAHACFARAEQLRRRASGPIDHARQLATHDA